MTIVLFAGGGWSGSTARIGVTAISNRMGLTLGPSPAAIGFAGISGEWITRLRWDPSPAAIGVLSFGGVFSGIGGAHGRTTMSVVGRTRTETRLPKHRTAMIVATGSSRTGER